MNIAIVGLGKFGNELVKTLSTEKHNIMVIDTSSQVVDDVVNEYDIQGYVGNGASYETLKEISIEKYDLLIATTQEDEMNILISLVAKKMGVKQTVCRVRNPEYQVESRQILGELGINHIFKALFKSFVYKLIKELHLFRCFIHNIFDNILYSLTFVSFCNHPPFY